MGNKLALPNAGAGKEIERERLAIAHKLTGVGNDHVHQELELPCCPLRRGAGIPLRYPIRARRRVEVAVDTPYDTVYGLFVECEPTFVPTE